MRWGVAHSLVLYAVVGLAAAPVASVLPLDRSTCPPSHPIKAAFSPRIRQCVYHVPGGPYYRTATPDVCFATEEDARAYAVKLTDDGRKALRTAEPLARKVDDRILEALPNRQRDQFINDLVAIVETLQKLSPQA